MVGATYGTIICGVMAIAFNKDTKQLYVMLGVYAAIALVQLLSYPIGGLLADICCGRYRIVMFSVFKLMCGFGLISIFTILLATSHDKNNINGNKNGHFVTYSEVILLIVSAILFISGFIGFQANAVQYGLDQLQEASSRQLSVFLHWYVWTDNLGQIIMRILATFLLCDIKNTIIKILVYAPIFFFLVLLVTLILSCYKHQWFHSEPCAHNPYGTVYRVLKFVAKHDKPIRRSALTFCDDERPSRMEFAKHRFGGPFTTEMVEDVKTFLRVIIIMLAIGPAYVITYVSACYLFPLYGLHVGTSNTLLDNSKCKYANWIIFGSGNLSGIITTALLPIYIIFFHSLVNKYIPKIIIRLGIGIVLIFLAVLSMLLILIIGTRHHSSATYSCMFNSSYTQKGKEPVSLGLPSAILSVPNTFIGIASPLIYITILEFISAQSPHTMKGLLLGVHYAIRGFYTLVGFSLVFPFAKPSWSEYNFFTCGVSYYLVHSFIGIGGILSFCVAARWYQYRKRDERPYGHDYVEDYYNRYMTRPPNTNSGDPEERAAVLVNNSLLDYGTMDGT